MDNNKKDRENPPSKSFNKSSTAEREKGNTLGKGSTNPRFNNVSRDSRPGFQNKYPVRRDTNTPDNRFQNNNDNKNQLPSSIASREVRVIRDRDKTQSFGRDNTERTNSFVRKPSTDFRNPRPQNAKFQPRGKFPPSTKVKKVKPEISTAPIVSELQITDGQHRSKYLKTTLSPKFRQTSGKVRDAMFRLIYRRVRFARILDLYAGIGTVGFEAISRGALLSTFVERSSKMCDFIKKNMESLEIKQGHGEIVEIEAMPFLKRIEKKKREWDVVFLNPPYDANYDEVLEFLGRGVGIRLRGCLVIEHHAEMFFPETIGCLHRWRVIIEGETSLSFYERK